MRGWVCACGCVCECGVGCVHAVVHVVVCECGVCAEAGAGSRRTSRISAVVTARYPRWMVAREEKEVSRKMANKADWWR